MIRKHMIWWLLLLTTLIGVVLNHALPTVATSPQSSYSLRSSSLPFTLHQAQALYHQGRFQEAAQGFQAAVHQYQQQGDTLGMAIALSNLALTYQQLGRWAEAADTIATALGHLETDSRPERLPILAQSLEIQGELQFARGQTEAALSTWERMGKMYRQLQDEPGITRSTLHQAAALQALGLYRRAIAMLTQLTHALEHQPDGRLTVVALRNLGDALRVAGTLERSRQVLEESIAMAQRLQLSGELASSRLSLGNTVQAQAAWDRAEALYVQVSSTLVEPMATQGRLYRMRLLANQGQEQAATALLLETVSHVQRLPSGRLAIEARLHLARTLLLLERKMAERQSAERQSAEQQIDQQTNQRGSGAEITRTTADLLAEAIRLATELGDERGKALALGALGNRYEQAAQWVEAQTMTEAALVLSQQLQAADITYLWEWQLGRIATATAQRPAAIAHYTSAIATLQTLRNDLVAVNPDVQFSFRDSIEPIHRELVSLLLNRTPTAEELEQARNTIESLQLAELDNFFREACLNAQPVQIDQIDRQTAVLYPILLSDRLEVILSISGQPLRHYATPNLSPSQVEAAVNEVRQLIVTRRSNARFQALTQQLYDGLIRPALPDLRQQQITTLVFVPDGPLRNLPPAVLNDGERFLIEDYAVAIAPSLQLLESRPLEPQQLSVLMAGLTKARQGFSPLPNVTVELEKIQAEVEGQVLLDEQFTRSALQSAIGALPFPVIHLATHGEFSSQLENTFVLTWDDRITINQLNTLLQTTDLTRRRPIELLVLSACKTADGDNRAALGLAGVAVRAGARSTLATLWSVSDEATPVLMEQFYQELAKGTVTKAEALRRSQLALLHNPQYSRPYFWAAFVLVGNWL